MVKKDCFRGFGEAVSDARRAGDTDPSNALLADTMKLLGNSAYGKTVINQENHRQIKIADEHTASLYINDKHFRALHDIGECVYEVELTKKVINLDLPLHIGFSVYQFAKLRMLQFYYDFLVEFVDVENFRCERWIPTRHTLHCPPAVWN